MQSDRLLLKVSEIMVKPAENVIQEMENMKIDILGISGTWWNMK